MVDLVTMSLTRWNLGHKFRHVCWLFHQWDIITLIKRLCSLQFLNFVTSFHQTSKCFIYDIFTGRKKSIRLQMSFEISFSFLIKKKFNQFLHRSKFFGVSFFCFAGTFQLKDRSAAERTQALKFNLSRSRDISENFSTFATKINWWCTFEWF